MDVDEAPINTDNVVLPGEFWKWIFLFMCKLFAVNIYCFLERTIRRTEAGIKNEKICINGSIVNVDGFPKEFHGYRFEVQGTFLRAGVETPPKDLSVGPRAELVFAFNKGPQDLS